MLKLVENLGHDHGPTAVDALTLRYEDRIKGRLRTTTDSGREAGLFLERGSALRDGDMLRAETGEFVRVKSAEEDLVTASCEDWGQFSKACYHLGNRHVSLEIGEKWVRFTPDHVLEHLAEHLGLTLSRTQAPFHPECGAYHGGHGH
jgi:urease accessory protein